MKTHIVETNDLLWFDPNETPTGITYWLQFTNCTSGNPTVNLFKAITNGVVTPFDYLTNSTVASNQVLEIRAFTNLTTTPQQISSNYIDRYDQPIGFLLEGCTTGKADLVFIMKKDGSEICRSAIQLELRKITDFYDVYRTYRIDPTNKVKWEAEVSNRCVQVQTNVAYTADSSEYLLLIHGHNMFPDDKLYFPQTAFKRLWWQGYRGGFGFYDWPNLTGLQPWKLSYKARAVIHDFDDSEMIAWLSATALAHLMEDLNSTGQLRVWAHSLGNVVTGEALRKYAGSYKIKAYIATQAAISGRAYDQAAPPTDFSLGFSANWYGPQTPRLFDSWGSGYPTNQPYLVSNTGNVERMCNYYNAQDNILAWWETGNRQKPDDIVGYSFWYGGLTNYYDETVNPTNRFYRWEEPTNGLDVLVATNLQDRYAVLAYDLESWSRALGQAANSAFSCTNKNLQLSPLSYDKFHYSHSREFRSNILDEKDFYGSILSSGNF